MDTWCGVHHPLLGATKLSQGYGALRDGDDQRLQTQHKPVHHNLVHQQPTRPNLYEDHEY